MIHIFHFSETLSLIDFFTKLSSTSLEIRQSNSTGELYVLFFCNDNTEHMVLLSKSVDSINVNNVRELKVSWVDGIFESGNLISNYMVHSKNDVFEMKTPNRIFNLISHHSEILSKKYFPDFSCENILDKFGEDEYERAFYFEYICLLYCHVSSILFANKPKIAIHIKTEICSLIQEHFNNRNWLIEQEIDLMHLFSKRLEQYYNSEDLKKFGLNIQKREYLPISNIILKNNHASLTDNSQLFYFWLIEPLFRDIPAKFELNKDEIEDYKLFLDTYVEQIIPLGKELVLIIN